MDASKGMVSWARDNAKLSGLEGRPIRWIVDDCEKFIQREIRRVNRYDGIVMDPPSYGRGPGARSGSWRIRSTTWWSSCGQLLSDNPFFLLNSYTTGLSASVMEYILASASPRDTGAKSSSEIGLPVKLSGYNLPCGSTAIWQKG